MLTVQAGRVKLALLTLAGLLVFSACANTGAVPRQPQPNQENTNGNISFSAHAGEYMGLFSADYPEMEITKLRWQLLPSGAETYVVEGNNGEEKCIVKYLSTGNMVLGRVQRPLAQGEMAGGKSVDKPLQLDELLSVTELCAIAESAMGGQVHELRVVHRGQAQIAYAQVVYEDNTVQGLHLDAETGEIVQQEPPAPGEENEQSVEEAGEQSPAPTESPESPESTESPESQEQPAGQEGNGEADGSQAASGGQAQSEMEAGEGATGGEEEPAAPAAPQQPEAASAQDTITVPAGYALVLNGEGAFLLLEGQTGEAEPDEDAWNQPSGYYNGQTAVELAQGGCYLRSLAPAEIGPIHGPLASLSIVGGSSIGIYTEGSVGVNVLDLTLGGEEGQAASLKIEAQNRALVYGGEVHVGPGSTLEATAALNGIACDSAEEEWYAQMFVAYRGATVRARATGGEGIALDGVYLELRGAYLEANAPAGQGAIRLKYFFSATAEEETRTVVKAESGFGRAISCFAMHVMESDISGVSNNGSIGIHVDQYLDSNAYNEGASPCTIYGRARSGFGVVVQSIDSGNSEFPSGSTSLQNTNLEGYVEEGMGISTYMLMANGYENGACRVTGTAERGIGISSCMLSAHDNVQVEGVSHGAAESHFQVYGAIPDSAGINALSYISVYGASSSLSGRAPTELEGSFGIHCLLPYEGGYASGNITAQRGEGDATLNLTGVGETGIYTLYFSIDNRVSITAQGGKDGLVATYLHAYGESRATGPEIYATGETGTGLALRSLSVEQAASMHTYWANIVALGGEYGIFARFYGELLLENSSFDARAQGQNAVAGGLFQADTAILGEPGRVVVSNSHLNAKSSGYGWLLADAALEIVADNAYSLPVPAHMKGEGGEAGISLQFSQDNLEGYRSGEQTALMLEQAPGYTLWGVSSGVAPDAYGRRGAIDLPSASVGSGAVLLEEYATPAGAQVSFWGEGQVYAEGMNISDYRAFTWQSGGHGLVAAENGLGATEGTGEFMAQISAERQTEGGSGTVFLNGGAHRVLLKADINIGTVSFDGNGGTPELETVQSPVGLPLVWAPEVTKAGAAFVQWQNADTGQGWNLETDALAGQSLALRALWQAQLFTLSFEGNAQGDASLTGMPEPQSREHMAGELIPRPEGTPQRNGMQFLYWSSSPDGAPWLFESDPMPPENLTLYAVWAREEIDILFDLNGGNAGATALDMRAVPGERVDISGLQPGASGAPFRMGHLFMGWRAENGTVAESSFTAPEQSLRLQAQWQPLEIEAPPEYLVAYRNEASRQDIERQLTPALEYTDLLNNTHAIEVRPVWNAAILGRGGVGSIVLNYVPQNSSVAVLTRQAHIYVLNPAVITAQDVQVFAFGQRISENGSEWDPMCYAELPDTQNQAIRRVSIETSFDLNGTDTGRVGRHSPRFTATYVDYFGTVRPLELTVTAIVSPRQGGDEDRQALSFWETVASRMREAGAPNYLFITAANYHMGGDRMLISPEPYSRRILARPGGFTNMTADALTATKNTPNAQLHVDLGWVQWYFGTVDFEGGEAHSGVYPLGVEQTEGNSTLQSIASGKNAMVLEFAMNKQWNGTPLLQVEVSQALAASADSGNTLTLFWYNPNTERLELIGDMARLEGRQFTIRMSRVHQTYIILDERPLNEDGLPDYDYTDMSDRDWDIPQAGGEREVAEMRMFLPSLLCTLIILLLLVVIGVLLWVCYDLRKKLRLCQQGEIAPEGGVTAHEENTLAGGLPAAEGQSTAGDSRGKKPPEGEQ